jgi:hypothetical protein
MQPNLNREDVMSKTINSFVMIFVVALAFSCAQKAAHVNSEKTDQPEQTILTVYDFDSMAPQYVGREIVIQGVVDHVCRETGKRMFLVQGDSNLRVKVTTGDEIPSFDVALEGSEVKVKGTVEELRVDEAYLSQWEDEITQQLSKEQKEVQQGQHKGLGEKADQGTHEDPFAVIKQYREKIAQSGTDHISFYSVACNEFHEILK